MEERMMMRFVKHTISCLLVSIMVLSCTDDWIEQNEKNIREGVPVTVSFDLSISAPKIVTRATQQNESPEHTVNRIYLFAFNSDGSLDNKQLFSINQSTTECITTITEFPMHSGYDKRFYAVANPNSGSGTLGTEQLAAIETEEQLLNLTSSLLDLTNIGRIYFLMSGKLEPATEGGQINVDEDGSLIGAKLCTDHQKPIIKLKKVDAKITFKIKGAEGLNFVPDRYWVENIPQHTYVFPHDEDYENREEGVTDYVSSLEENIHRFVTGPDKDGFYSFEFYILENRKTPKSRIDNSAKQTYPDVENYYALREQREKKELETPNPDKPEQKYENGEFVFANKNSTYVIIHGILSYQDKDENNNDRFVYADATYTIHLGDTGMKTDADNIDKVNDYNTNRNTHYTYTVNITGIHSLYVEVKKEEGAKEERPGAEGDLIISSSDIRRLDAHYGRIYFTLKRKDIKKGLTWAVKTPFQSGMKAFDADNFAKTADGELKQESEYTNSEKERLMTYLPIDENAPEGAVRLNDYKWVQFVINSEVSPKVDLGFFAKYPGFNAYEGGQGENIPAPPFGGEGYRNGNEYYNEDAVLYDVNQLINHLYLEANNENSEIFVNPQTGNMDEEVNSDNAIVAVTAFIDEYVYKYDPTTVYHENPDPATHENLLLWKRVVNGDDRMLHLCTSSNIYSLDGNTSLSENVLSITQRPIYTFYNQNDLDIGTAWGTESVNETGRLQVATGNLENKNLPGKFTNSHKNGRQNTLNIIPNIGNVDENGIKGWNSSGLKWSDVLQRDAEAFGTLNSRYDNIWYACLGRNRDLDGDNQVDANEIRWYLAAIDQLTDIWIGESSLEESARLYTNEVCSPYDLGSIRRHVASSTRYDGTDGSVQGMSHNPWVIWAEEGASVGSWNDSHSYNGNSNETKGRDYYEYRCVRNLGLSLDDINYDNSSEEMEVENYIETLDEKTVTVFDKKYKERYIYLPKLEFNSVRSASISGEDIMPAHHERDEYNLPYRKFAVIVSEPETSNDDGIYPPKENSKHTQSQSHGWSYYQDQMNERNVCPRGYRIPNQRETMLLYTTYPDLYQLNVNANNYTYYDSSNGAYHFYFMIKTAFSFDGIGLYLNNRDGFSYDAAWQTLNLLTTWNNGDYPPGKVRCVRDVTE